MYLLGKYRLLLNATMVAATGFWVLVLYQVTVDGVDVISANLRFISYLLMFAGVVITWACLMLEGKEGGQRITPFEGVYWFINIVFFFIILFVGLAK